MCAALGIFHKFFFKMRGMRHEIDTDSDTHYTNNNVILL